MQPSALGGNINDTPSNKNSLKQKGVVNQQGIREENFLDKGKDAMNITKKGALIQLESTNE